MPEYVKRYLKQEYGKNAAFGYGMFHGTPNGKFLGLPGRLGKIGSKHNAQDFNQENLPWRLENNKLKWWQNFGPNRKYSLVNVPKPPVEQPVQVSQANNIASLRNMAQRFNMALNKAADPAVNLQSPKAKQQYKQIVVDRLLQQFDYRNKNRGRSLEQYINYLNTDPKIQKIAAVKGMDLKDIYNVLKAKHPNMSDIDLAKLISLYFIRYGKSGMKIPKYQEA